jgi:hypothetical protein
MAKLLSGAKSRHCGIAEPAKGKRQKELAVSNC